MTNLLHRVKRLEAELAAYKRFVARQLWLRKLDPADGNFVVGDGVGWVVESGGTALASMGGQPLDADLSDIAELGGTGLAARTAADSWALRTITGTANEVSVSNGNGVSGNPTLSLPSTISMASRSLDFNTVVLRRNATHIAEFADDNAAGRVVVRITNTGVSGAWGVTGFGALDFYSNDPSGIGAGVRARLEAQMTNAAGSASDLMLWATDSSNLSRVLVVSHNSTFVGPNNDNTYDSAQASLAWKDIYSVNAVTVTSDAGWKKIIGPVDGALLEVGKELAAKPQVFQWLSANADKGADGARLHVGWIYQDVVAAFEAHGLDPFRYGVVGHAQAVEEVAVSRTERRQKMASEEVTTAVVDTSSGTPVLTTRTTTAEYGATEAMRVCDAEGNPMLTADGSPWFVDVPVTEEIAVADVETVPQWEDEAKTVPKMRGFVRPAELAAIIVAGLNARLAALEAGAAA